MKNLTEIKIDLIGRTVEEARVLLAETEFPVVRVKSIDGKGMVGTCDFRRDRINVEVVAGKITRVRGVG